MKFRKQIFGFLDMLRFKKLVPNRAKALQNGSDKKLPTEYKTNNLAHQLHPIYMDAKISNLRLLNDDVLEITFERIDESSFPFFRSGQYVSVQKNFGDEYSSRAYSIVSSPRDALLNHLTIAVEKAGYFSSKLFEAKVGDVFKLSEPSGEFYYSRLRDHKNLVFIAGGVGITPFLAMIKDKIDREVDYNITLIYGAKSYESLIYRDFLDDLAARKIIKVIYVLEKKKKGYLNGIISKEIIKDYSLIENSSYFICGSNNMKKAVNQMLSELGVLRKNIRFDCSSAENLNESEEKTYQIKVHVRDKIYQIPARSNETILTALDRADIASLNRCRGGTCGFCHSKVLSGKYTLGKNKDERRLADIKFNFIHPCVTYPLSDMEIEIPYLNY